METTSTTPTPTPTPERVVLPYSQSPRRLELSKTLQGQREEIKKVLAGTAEAAVYSKMREADLKQAAKELPEGSETITAQSTTEEVFALAAEIHEAKKALPNNATRYQFKEGRRFRVIREGARLEGLVFFGSTTWSGWTRALEVGEIVTCNGWVDGFNTPGIRVVTFAADRVPDNTEWVSVWPLASLWKPYPAEGYLELIEENEDEL
jgi:hypothetical protein